MRDFSTPEHLDDIPPPLAERIEECRRRALDWLAAHDYRLVIPPLVEYLETLTAGDDDLDLQTFKITDSVSGRTLGIRADQTPQIARFDSRPRAEQTEARRYCYCGPILASRPPQAWQARETIQLGAELFGAPSPLGDWEIARLALGALESAGAPALCLDVGHAGLFAAAAASLAADVQRELADQISCRDQAAIRRIAARENLPASLTRAMVALAGTHGKPAAIDAARADLAATDETALADITYVIRQLRAEKYDAAVSLSDLGSYGYHRGIVFVIYSGNHIVATGGRYQSAGGGDGVGFSIDLRAVGKLIDAPAAPPPVSAPWVGDDPAWQTKINELRAAGRRIRFVAATATPPPPRLCKVEDNWTVREK